jgi:hypothetical protein
VVVTGEDAPQRQKQPTRQDTTGMRSSENSVLTETTPQPNDTKQHMISRDFSNDRLPTKKVKKTYKPEINLDLNLVQEVPSA